MKPLDEASRDVIKEGQAGEAPTRADRERLRRRLGAALAAGVAGPAIAAPVAKAAQWWASKAALAGVGTAGLVVVAAAAVVWPRVTAGPVPPAPPAVTSRVAQAPAPVAVEPALEADAPDTTVAAAPVEDEPPRAPARSPPRSKKPPRAAVKKAEEPSMEPLPVAKVAAPEPQLRPPEPDTLEAETSGLREVYAALKLKDSAQALRLLAAQEARFPKGQLQPERDAARVLALCASSPTEGSAALARFLATHPGSPLLARLKGACTP